MPRWYQGFLCRGNRKRELNNLKRAIKNHHLERFLPKICVEKESKSPDFYLFLEVKSPVIGRLPPEVLPIIQLGLLPPPLPSVLTSEDIKGLAPICYELTISDYVLRLPYRPLPTPQQDDPFEAVDESSEEAEQIQNILVRTQALDRLLLWLSAKGQGSWNLFRGAYQALGLGKDGRSTGSIARCLRLLGHIEFSSNRKKWSIAPTVLVKSDFQEDDDEYILCGQRHPAMLQALRSIASVAEVPQSAGEGPATIRIFLTTLSSLPDNYQFHNRGQVANQLARLLPSSKKWMNSLEELPNVMPELSRLKRFTGKSFTWKAFDRKSGLYEFWDLESDSLKYTLYYDAKRKRWLRGDWYGLRFLALQADRTPCPVNYDQATGCLAIPHNWRWPELYERVLVLASGRLPERHHGWLRYEGISPQTLDELQIKLNLEIEELNDA